MTIMLENVLYNIVQSNDKTLFIKKHIIIKLGTYQMFPDYVHFNKYPFSV